MQTLILTMIFAVSCLPYLVGKEWLPGVINYLPELLSLIVLVIVIVRGVQSRFQYVRPIYWILFGSILVDMIFGALINHLEVGPMFAGLRSYLRAIPFFLLPAVWLVKEDQLRGQLKLLTVICLIQLPLAWSQRMGTVAAGAITGDMTVGTLTGSGTLSLFLISAACVLTGFFLKHRLSAKAYLALLVLFLLPTSLNETKITFVLVPMAMLTTYVFGSSPGVRMRNAALAIIGTIAFVSALVPIYDHFMKPRWGYGIMDFVTMEGRLEGYLLKGAEVGDVRRAGKFDSLVASVDYVSRDPPTFAFGLGLANASDSALGDQFDGAYYRVFGNFPLNSLSYILLELGAVGVVFVLLLHWNILIDCLVVVRRGTGAPAALAAGWVGVSVVAFCSLVYSSPITTPVLSYLYWYLSGVVVAFRMRLGEHDPVPAENAAGIPATGGKFSRERVAPGGSVR